MLLPFFFSDTIIFKENLCTKIPGSVKWETLGREVRFPFSLLSLSVVRLTSLKIVIRITFCMNDTSIQCSNLWLKVEWKPAVSNSVQRVLSV